MTVRPSFLAGFVLILAVSAAAAQQAPIKPKPPEPKKEGPADPFAKVDEIEPNDSPTTAQKVTLPVSIHGSIAKAGDMDYYRFDAKAGQEIGVQVQTSAIGSKLEPTLVLTDAAGKIVAESTNGLLGYTCPTAGAYALGIRDRDYRGGADMPYRLNVGDLPVVTSVFPLGLQRGTEQEFIVEGVNLGGRKTSRVKAPADAAPGTRIPVNVTAPHGAPLGNVSVVVGEFREVQSLAHASGSVTAPFTANGRIEKTGAAETWTFAAKKGQRLILEVNARRLGSPLDSVIEILDAHDHPVPRAVLRSVAKTYIVFRDHDSAGSGIRIESWSELRINDYLYVGGELLRIRELPKGPDDDCQFYSGGGQRLRLARHDAVAPPPGRRHVQGDAPSAGHDVSAERLPGHHPALSQRRRRPRLRQGLAARLRSAGRRRVSSPRQRCSRPGRQRLRLSSDGASAAAGLPRQLRPTAPSVWKGGAVPVNVNVERLDDFDGRIDVHLDNLPPGFSASASNILSEDNSTAVALSADADAANPAANAPPLKVIARAMIDGKEVVREATGSRPKVIDSGDIVTTTEQSEVTVKPGGETRLTVTVQRAQRFHRPHSVGCARSAAWGARAGHRTERHPHHGEGDDADDRDLRGAVGRAGGASVRGAGPQRAQGDRTRGEVGAAEGIIGGPLRKESCRNCSSIAVAPTASANSDSRLHCGTRMGYSWKTKTAVCPRSICGATRRK